MDDGYYEVKIYMNSKGYRLQALIPQTEKKETVYRGVMVMQAADNTTQEMTFPIVATSVQKAFENFKDSAKAAVEEVKKRADKPAVDVSGNRLKLVR